MTKVAQRSQTRPQCLFSNVDRQTRTPHTEGSSSGPRVRGQAGKRTPSSKKIFPVSGLWEVFHHEIVYCTACSVPFS
jgi:hypothetical protein